MSAKDNAIRLVVKNESYYSRLDEDSFYAWLDKIACVEKYHGQGRELYIDVDRLRVDDSSLRELLAVFERYKIDMRQLAIFKHKNNENWFCDPQKYWFEKVFGSDAQKPK